MANVFTDQMQALSPSWPSHVLSAQDGQTFAAGPPSVMAGREQNDAAGHCQHLLMRLPALVFELGPDGAICYVNQAVTPLTGYTPPQLHGRNWWVVFFPGKRLQEAYQLYRQLHAGDLVRAPMSLTTRSGGVVALEVSTSNLYGPDGRLQRVVGLGSVVNTPAPLAAPVSPSAETTTPEQRLSLALNAGVDAFVLYGPSSEILEMNAAAEALLGTSRNDWGLTVAERVDKVALRAVDGSPYPPGQLPVMRALRGEIVRGEVLALEHPCARTYWVSVSAAPVYGPDDGLLGAVVTFSDITAHYQLSAQQEVFTHTVSHDLRIPITIIQGHADILHEGLAVTKADSGLRSHTDAILRNVHRMEVMIQDLVTFARLEGQQYIPAFTSLLLQTYLAEMLEACRMALPSERVLRDLPADLPPVRCDADHLERIVINLLSNALKYSDPDTAVHLRARREGDCIVVSVTDQGQGITKEELAHLFERFFRAKTGRKAEGIGLGLYITKMLVEAGGGRIWAESQVGQGSTFSFTLPLDASASPEAAG